MTRMSKWAVFAVTTGVWVTAVGSAAALTYGLNRPLRAADIVSHHATRHAAAPNTAFAAVVEPVSESQSVLRVPTITVVGYVAEHDAVARAPEKAVDISQMHCSDWRELDIGSGHVQVCE
jgi:hypothetical protein